ncbi:MAG: hypothetical protein Q7V88_15270 [Actinomycetota bacterium]|nr:hypothetical protein [Actinomycetota bacterium]
MIIGVNPHKSSHTATAVDASSNRPVAPVRVEATLAGYRELMRWSGLVGTDTRLHRHRIGGSSLGVEPRRDFLVALGRVLATQALDGRRQCFGRSACLRHNLCAQFVDRLAQARVLGTAVTE